MKCIVFYKTVWWWLCITGNILAFFAILLYCLNDAINSSIYGFTSVCMIIMCILSWCVCSVGKRFHRGIHLSDDEDSDTTISTIDSSQTSKISEISEISNIPPPIYLEPTVECSV